MRRREFITLLGVATATWPLAVQAQQGQRVRRIGLLLGGQQDDPEVQARVATLRDTLSGLGWIDGQNIHFEPRWGGGAKELQAGAADLARIGPDVIITQGHEASIAMRRETQTIPIVFVRVGDPARSGFVASLARPGGNMTGLAAFEAGTIAKWLELLGEVTPGLTRVLVLGSRQNPRMAVQLREIEAVAPPMGVQLTIAEVRDEADLRKAFETFPQDGKAGVLVLPSNLATSYRAAFAALATQYRLPAVYPSRVFAEAGGLLAYGPDWIELYRGAASYVDRILNGAQPADLPVQQPTKFELVINLKTAKALGIEVPPSLLARADEVIE